MTPRASSMISASVSENAPQPLSDSLAARSELPREETIADSEYHGKNSVSSSPAEATAASLRGPLSARHTASVREITCARRSAARSDVVVGGSCSGAIGSEDRNVASFLADRGAALQPLEVEVDHRAQRQQQLAQRLGQAPSQLGREQVAQPARQLEQQLQLALGPRLPRRLAIGRSPALRRRGGCGGGLGDQALGGS